MMQGLCAAFKDAASSKIKSVPFHLTEGRLSVSKVSLLLENYEKKYQNQLNGTF